MQQRVDLVRRQQRQLREGGEDRLARVLVRRHEPAEEPAGHGVALAKLHHVGAREARRAHLKGQCVGASAHGIELGPNSVPAAPDEDVCEMVQQQHSVRPQGHVFYPDLLEGAIRKDIEEGRLEDAGAGGELCLQEEAADTINVIRVLQNGPKHGASPQEEQLQHDRFHAGRNATVRLGSPCQHPAGCFVQALRDIVQPVLWLLPCLEDIPLADEHAQRRRIHRLVEPGLRTRRPKPWSEDPSHVLTSAVRELDHELEVGVLRHNVSGDTEEHSKADAGVHSGNCALAERRAVRLDKAVGGHCRTNNVRDRQAVRRTDCEGAVPAHRTHDGGVEVLHEDRVLVVLDEQHHTAVREHEALQQVHAEAVQANAVDIDAEVVQKRNARQLAEDLRRHLHLKLDILVVVRALVDTSWTVVRATRDAGHHPPPHVVLETRLRHVSAVRLDELQSNGEGDCQAALVLRQPALAQGRLLLGQRRGPVAQGSL
mmetsp:Transcript_19608/g.75270  ORF Transcript_19608/g.75270 Transcript_19608/m.75270 type:complete len:485 (+) Transcript_19608:79-1533(+)